VVIPYRDLSLALPLKVSGDLGMTVLHVLSGIFLIDVRNTISGIRMQLREQSNTVTLFTTSLDLTTKPSKIHRNDD